MEKMTLFSKSIDYDADDFHGSEFDTSKLEVIGKVLMEQSQMLLSDNVNIITPLCKKTLFCCIYQIKWDCFVGGKTTILSIPWVSLVFDQH